MTKNHALSLKGHIVFIKKKKKVILLFQKTFLAFVNYYSRCQLLQSNQLKVNFFKGKKKGKEVENIIIIRYRLHTLMKKIKLRLKGGGKEKKKRAKNDR